MATRKDYYREYYEKNKERHSALMKEYFQNHREEIIEKHKQYSKEHREQINAYRRRKTRENRIEKLENVIIPELQETVSLNEEECASLLEAITEHKEDKAFLLSEHKRAVSEFSKNKEKLHKKQAELYRLKQEVQE